METEPKRGAAGKWLSLAALAALVLGLVLGLATPRLFAPIAFLGDVYINLLKLIVIPLLMAEVMAGVYGAARTVVGRLCKTVVLFVCMFVASFLLMAALTALVRPGAGLSLFGDAWTGEPAAASVGGFLMSIFPSNLFSAMSAGSILPCILFAFAAGIAAGAVKAEKAMAVVEDCRRIFARILSYIMYLTPVGVFVLIGGAAAEHGAQLFGVCARYILTAWAGCALVTVFVLILPVWVYAKIPPWTYLRRVGKIWLITLSTCSSAATLPNTIRVCNEEFGIPPRITGVVVPLGCTIHMCGGAVSFCLLGLFTMQMAGTPVTAGMFLYMLFVATLMNMAAPGIPGGGIVLGATYLSILGAPTGFIGLYGGVYRLLDMAYTSVNVTGDISANILIARSEGCELRRQSSVR